MTELAAVKRFSSANLKMAINPGGRGVHDELSIEAPYEFVVSFVSSEMGHDLRGVEFWINEIKRAMAGETVDIDPGNSWGIAASEETATLPIGTRRRASRRAEKGELER